MGTSCKIATVLFCSVHNYEWPNRNFPTKLPLCCSIPSRNGDSNKIHFCCVTSFAMQCPMCPKDIFWNFWYGRPTFHQNGRHSSYHERVDLLSFMLALWNYSLSIIFAIVKKGFILLLCLLILPY